MISEHFEEEMKTLGEKLTTKKSPSFANYSAQPKFKASRVFNYLLSNCANILQPMEQGFIRSSKVQYRKNCLKIFQESYV